MGIKQVFSKTASAILDFVGIDKKDIKKCFGYVQTPAVAASIGSVLSNVLPKEEVADKFESGAKNNENTESKQTVAQTQTQVSVPTSTSSSISGETKNNSQRNVVAAKKSANVTEDDLNKVRIELRAKCQENGINFAQMMVNLSALTGKTLVEFSKMDKNLQITLLSYVIETINRVEKANLPDVKKIEAVVTDVALLYEFITHDKKGNVCDIENLTADELKGRRLLFEEKIKMRKKQRLAEIEKLPESEREAAKQALKEEFSGYRKHIFDELSKKIPFETAMELILVVSVKDLGDAARELMESYPVEIREKIANTLQDYDSFREYIKTHRADCENLTQDEINAINQYHKIFGTYKTKENLEAYEASFQESRKNGEFSENIYKATAMGIGEAAYANINMTSEEKDTFIQNWVRNNDGLLTDADMAQVEERAKGYIEELLNKNPEIKDNFQAVKRNIKEIVEKTLNRVFENRKEASKENKTKEANAQIKKLMTSPSGKVHSLNKEVLSHAQQYIRIQAAKFETPAIKKSTEQIEFALVKGIINEKQALKNLDNSEHKFIKMCVQNSKLASKYDERIKLYIQTEKDEEKLKAIATVAPHDIVIKIVHNMRGNRERLTEELIRNHEVDFNTKVLLTKSTEENAA